MWVVVVSRVAGSSYIALLLFEEFAGDAISIV